MSPVHFSQIHPRAFAHPSDLRATPLRADSAASRAAKEDVATEDRRDLPCSPHVQQHTDRPAPTPIALAHGARSRRTLMHPAPRTYISRHGGANAFAFGRNTHSIILTSSLVDMMSDRELQGIIAHEMGHILCQHMLYMGVGLALSNKAMPLTKVLPGLEESLMGLFFAWFRAAEYSADRAALLILEDPEPLAQALAALPASPGASRGSTTSGCSSSRSRTTMRKQPFGPSSSPSVWAFSDASRAGEACGRPPGVGGVGRVPGHPRRPLLDKIRSGSATTNSDRRYPEPPIMQETRGAGHGLRRMRAGPRPAAAAALSHWPSCRDRLEVLQSLRSNSQAERQTQRNP